MRAIFVGGACDAQERLVCSDRAFWDARMQTGEVVRYRLMLRYGDTLLYAHKLSLYQVMDLLVNHYCIGDGD
jgi:hypothetical protein